MDLNFDGIPSTARTSVETLLYWCAQQLSDRNTNRTVAERQSIGTDSGLELQANVVTGKNPEGVPLAVCRVVLELQPDYATNDRTWEAVKQISIGPSAANYYA